MKWKNCKITLYKTVCETARFYWGLTRATEILKSKSVHSTDDIIDVIRTCVWQSKIVTKTHHFHPKVYQKLIIFLIQSNLLEGNGQGIIQNCLLKTGACLIQGSINIRCGVWIHPFFQCPKGSLFFIKSLLVYKFQGRQPFRMFRLNIFFSTNAVLILFCTNKLQDLKSKTYWKMFFS